MSTVPPSPACAITLVVAATLDPQRRRDPGRHRGSVPEQGVQPRDLPRRLRVGRREHLEAAGGVDGHHAAAGGAHGRIDGVAGAERLATALAGPVARGQRVGALGAGLHGAVGAAHQPVADGEAPDLVEADAHGSADPRGGDAEVAQHVLGRGPGVAMQRHALELAFDQARVEVEEGQAPQPALECRLEDTPE